MDTDIYIKCYFLLFEAQNKQIMFSHIATGASAYKFQG